MQIGQVQGAMTRAGGNLTEATTTSSSPVDLLTAPNLGIPANRQIQFLVGGRKTTGAAAKVGLGLKINSTIVCEANGCWESSSANQAESGGCTCWVKETVPNYSFGAVAGSWASWNAAGTPAAGNAFLSLTANAPNAVRSSLTVRAKSNASGLITVGAGEFNVYTLANG